MGDPVSHFISPEIHNAAFTEGMIAQTKIGENLLMCNTVMSKKIIDLITKPGFRSSLEGMDIEQVIRNMKYEKKNTGEKIRYILPEEIADMAIYMEVSTGIIRKVPGDMP